MTPLSHIKRKELEKQGYRIVGSHSAVKVCMWCKRALTGEDTCYKNEFYGIRSWQCVQMTPALPFCTLRCAWCWRDIDFTYPAWQGPVDEPETIIDGCIAEHKKYLMGMLGNSRTSRIRFNEAMQPKHFAISLSGEPTFYPKLPELIKQLGQRNLTSFLVTNGTKPAMLRKLIKSPLTQLYITLPACDEETFKSSCNPLVRGAWGSIMKSLAMLEQFTCRKAVRMTLAKGVNMANPELYGKLLKSINADFFEVKAYMHVGYSRYRLEIGSMPLHSEIRKFAEEIAASAGLKVVAEKPLSRVVLLMRKDTKQRMLKL